MNRLLQLASVIALALASSGIEDDHPGQPLILTKLLREGRAGEARSASEVHYKPFGSIKSHSGYFTVDDRYDSNLFFWYFPNSLGRSAAAPVVVWLQGGPGDSSLFGALVEHGPFYIGKGGDVITRKFAWTTSHHVVYIDSPVGTGFSFTSAGYARNQTKVGEDLYQALLQFFQLFPDLAANEVFVSGESYAGKYVPALAYTILKKGKINLKGISVGNGFSDPVNQLRYSDYLYQTGLIDLNTKSRMHELEKTCSRLINGRNWVGVFKTVLDMVAVFQEATGLESFFNWLASGRTNPSADADAWSGFLQTDQVRKAIHVGTTAFRDHDLTVKAFLFADIFDSVATWVEELLDNYKVLIYNGQLDILVPYPQTVNYLRQLKFDSSDRYRNASRTIWYVDGEIAGYVKEAGNLTEVLVRNSGHMVPGDQPRWALDLISRFTRSKSFC